MLIEVKNGLIITAPKGAVFGLYSGVPSCRNYFEAIHPENALAPTCVSIREDRAFFHYEDLAEGIYHYAYRKIVHICTSCIILYNSMIQ